MWSGAAWLVLAMAMLLAAAACGGGAPRTPFAEDRVGVVTATVAEGAAPTRTRPPPRFVSKACNGAFANAAAAKDLWQTVENLFPALDTCDSLSEWVGASYHNRGAIVNDVDPVRFAITACESYDEASAAPVCRDLGY